jgi:transposase
MKQDLRELSSDAQAALRQKAIQMVMAGKAQVEVVTLFGICKQVISRWVCRFRREGAASWKARRRGRPSECRLKPYQAATVVRLISDRCPDQLKMPFVLWTREAVQDLIVRKFGIRLSVWTIGRYLRQWGFSPQKPIRRAYERDPEAVEHWLRKKYPAIRRQAQRERATIFWGDETGMRSDHQAGRSWGRRGQTPVIPGTGKRFRCNMISAITNRGKLAFMVFDSRFTGTVFIRFLWRLIRHSRRKVFLIIDEHPVHVSALVKRWTIRYKKHICVFYLPGYSPELNPDELLNQDVKTNAVGRKRPRDKHELIGNVRNYLRSTQKRPQKVRTYFQAPLVRYAAD